MRTSHSSGNIYPMDTDSIYDVASWLASRIRCQIPTILRTIPISSSIYRSIADINPDQPYLIHPHRPYIYDRNINDDIMNIRCYISGHPNQYVCQLVGRIRYRRQGCIYEYLYYSINHNRSCIKLRLKRPCNNCEGFIALTLISVFDLDNNQ